MGIWEMGEDYLTASKSGKQPVGVHGKRNELRRRTHILSEVYKNENDNQRKYQQKPSEAYSIRT